MPNVLVFCSAFESSNFNREYPISTPATADRCSSRFPPSFERTRGQCVQVKMCSEQNSNVQNTNCLSNHTAHFVLLLQIADKTTAGLNSQLDRLKPIAAHAYGLPVA